jgi:heme-degrading monooxygenase HmoA
MMTVITRVALDAGTEPTWDEAMRARMETAVSADGWVSGQILIPLGDPSARVIIGVWETRAAWEAWHEAPEFLRTRERLEEIGADDGDTVWHESIFDAP